MFALCAQLFSHVQFFMVSWTIACQAPLLWNLPGKNTGMVATAYSRVSSQARDQPSSRCNFGIWLWKVHQLTMFLQQKL